MKATRVLRSSSRSTPQACITRAASGSSIRARSRCSSVASSCLRWLAMRRARRGWLLEGGRERRHRPRPSGLSRLGPARARTSEPWPVTVKVRCFRTALQGRLCRAAGHERKKFACECSQPPAWPVVSRRRASERCPCAARIAAKTSASGASASPIAAFKLGVRRAQERVGRASPAPRREGTVGSPVARSRRDRLGPRAAAPGCPASTDEGEAGVALGVFVARADQRRRRAAPPAGARRRHICVGVPSKSRPQPIAIRLSADEERLRRRGSGRRCGRPCGPGRRSPRATLSPSVDACRPSRRSTVERRQAVRVGRGADHLGAVGRAQRARRRRCGRRGGG